MLSRHASGTQLSRDVSKNWKRDNAVDTSIMNPIDLMKYFIVVLFISILPTLTSAAKVVKNSYKNSKIAFVSTVAGNKEIFICDSDGKNPKQLTHNNSTSLFPAWSYDANWIAYTSYKNGKPNIYIENLNGNRSYVISQKGANTTPAWIPNKFELAASLSLSGDYEIYLLSGKGKIIKRLTRKAGIDVFPSWSPDGKKMVFVSTRPGSPQLYIMTVESKHVERLTFEGRNNMEPCWFPKGDLIIYSSVEDELINIYVISLDDNSPNQLTRTTGLNESPSWSPDGRFIVFSSTREGPSRIYVMEADGKNQRRLLTLPGEQSNPKWSPEISNK